MSAARVELAADMDDLMVAARRHVGIAFDSEGSEEPRRQALSDVGRQRDMVLAEIRRFAGEHSFALEATPSGVVAVPVMGDRTLTPDDVRLLTPERQAELERNGGQVQEAFVAGLRRLRQLDREAADQTRRVDREIAVFAIDPLLQALREKHRELPDVLAHLDRVREDIVDNVADFRPRGTEAAGPNLPWKAGAAEDRANRYQANVLVDNAGLSGAPLCSSATRPTTTWSVESSIAGSSERWSPTSARSELARCTGPTAASCSSRLQMCCGIPSPGRR